MIAISSDQLDCLSKLLDAFRTNIAPRPIVPSWEWVCRNGRAPEAVPFDGSRMPWGKGVCEAWDDPEVREVVLMWGTRLGKTMIGLQLMAKSAATNPMPGIFATKDEKLAIRTTKNKIYPVLSAIRETRVQLMPMHLRNHREIRLTQSVWPVAWAGSESLFADWGAMYGWGNEFSKWRNTKSVDGLSLKGDVVSRFYERFKEYWHSRKVLVESSPGLKGHCPIERKYLESNQCRYHVPCPHCKQHQVLKLGLGDDCGGIVFEKLPSGQHDAELAQRTAKYQCESCKKLIGDEDRPRMMRCGVWAPKGCTVDKKGKLCGKSERKCDIWGGQLSSLYSLQMRWGDIARRFVESRRSPVLFQVFVNDWLADTWEQHRVKSEPEEVAERLATDDELGIIPAWCTWSFAAVDVQAEYFKWMKVACGTDGAGGIRVAIVDRGICDTWNEVYDQCVNDETKHADGGLPLLPCLTLIDSGDGKKTDEVYQKCWEWSRIDRLVIPCKGANTDCGASYEKRVIIPEKHKSRTLKRQALRAQGAVVIRVNSFWHEPILQRWIDERRPDELDSLSIPSELCDDDEFMHELCNGVQSDDPSKMNPDRLLWKKRWPDDANDFRDCLKYGRCAIDVKFRGNLRLVAKRQPSAEQIKSALSAQARPTANTARRPERRMLGGGRRVSIGERRVSR